MTAPDFTLAATIEHLAPRLPRALVAPASLDAVRGVAASLPAPLMSWIDFECRLHPDRPQVDLSVRVDHRSREHFAKYALARQMSSSSLAWRRAADLAEHWATPGSPVALDVDALWLEFDVDADDAASRPRLFIDIARGARAGASSPSVLTNTLEPMLDRPLPGWIREGTANCLRHLPSGAELLYIGLPASDRVSVVRLCFLGIDEDAAADYLAAVGWPGDSAALRRALGSGGRDATRAAILHVDVIDRGGVGSRIGLEFPFRRRPQVKGVVSDTQLLESLVARGACAVDKRNALLAWPGCEMSILPHTIWPSLIMRRISHVKIVFDGDRPPEAKAYLCVGHIAKSEVGSLKWEV